MRRKHYKITFHKKAIDAFTDEEFFSILLKLTALHSADLLSIKFNDYVPCEVIMKCSLLTRNLFVADFLEEIGDYICNIEVKEV